MEEPTDLDTTVLSNFAYEGDFAVLSYLPRASTVPGVEREPAQGAEPYPYLSDALAFVRSDEVAVLESPDTGFSETLGPGETEVLVVVEDRGAVAVTDDMDARRLLKTTEWT